MKVAFTPGTRVSFETVNGTRAKAFISNYLKSWRWRIPGYLGEGFYHLVTSTGKYILMSEDDLELAPVTLGGVLDYLYPLWQAGGRQDDNLYDAIQIVERRNRS